MPKVSQRGEIMPASPIRRLGPLYQDAVDRGLKVYRLNIGQPDLPTPREAFEVLKHIDRTVLDSFAHANLGPKATKAGRLILEVEAEIECAVPNVSMKYDPKLTSDEFAVECVKSALATAKPSFANHRMFVNELIM